MDFELRLESSVVLENILKGRIGTIYIRLGMPRIYGL